MTTLEKICVYMEEPHERYHPWEDRTPQRVREFVLANDGGFYKVMRWFCELAWNDGDDSALDEIGEYMEKADPDRLADWCEGYIEHENLETAYDRWAGGMEHE